MAEIKLHKSSKLFYREYPYKITYKRLYGFPSADILKSTRWGLNYNSWWFELPEGEEDMKRRTNCYHYLRNLETTKFNNSTFTHVYFKDKVEFDKASKRYKELQTEHYVPVLENLAEVIGKFTSNVELKKSLYHKKYKYKVILKFDRYLEEKLGKDLYDMYNDNPNYFLNVNVRRFREDLQPKSHYTGTYRYTWRHSYYNLYAIYCYEKIDMELLTFVASENISKITKAVLFDDLDK